MKARKVLLLVLDGVGIGAAPDAAAYGDADSDTLGHLAEAVGGLRLPYLAELGLGNIAPLRGLPPAQPPRASFGKMAPASAGKDSTAGHWELAGLITRRPFPIYPTGFPPELMQRFVAATGCGGVLGNKPASGTAIIEELGEEHLRTGWPIVYTSADSVFQIAAHEQVIPLARLYEICHKTRHQVCVGQHEVSRVIARPFVGTPGAFVRTAHRRDFSVAPPSPTLLDVLTAAGVAVTTIGKVDELFAGRGVGLAIHTRSNAEALSALVEQGQRQASGLVFATLTDFDMLYGHRNDAAGFARALEALDAALTAVLETLAPEDLLILTADHGNDPTTPSTDHSREYVPLLVYRAGRAAGVDLGVRSSFADVGRTVADYFGVPNELDGQSFLAALA